MPAPPSHPARRLFLRHSAHLAIVGAGGIATGRAIAAQPVMRSLALDNTHTGEQLTIMYAVAERYVTDALNTLNHFLRDHYSGDVGVMDPQLFDLLHRIRTELGTRQPYEVISGYRSPKTNETLRITRGGGVAGHSLHMDGKAIDIRLRGVPLTELRDAALSLRAGGVGYYPREQFVHVDTGRVRRW